MTSKLDRDFGTDRVEFGEQADRRVQVAGSLAWITVPCNVSVFPARVAESMEKWRLASG